MPTRALVLGDGPSYHAVAHVNWRAFDGLVVCAHYFRHGADAVVTIDPRAFDQKERHALGRARVVVAMSHWARRMGLQRHVPRDCKGRVEWGWCERPVLTSGVYAIEWAAAQGCTEIYTLGVDLTPGYHRVLDTQRGLLGRAMAGLAARGVQVFKGHPRSTLPVPLKDPRELLPPEARGGERPLRQFHQPLRQPLRQFRQSLRQSRQPQDKAPKAVQEPQRLRRAVLRRGPGAPRVVLVPDREP